MLPPKFTLTVMRSDPKNDTDGENLKKSFGDISADMTLPPHDVVEHPGSFGVRVMENKRVTPENHWQDVRLITFSMGSEKQYLPGDVLTIFPKNFPAEVQTLIDLMDWNDVADLPLQFNLRDCSFSELTGFYPLSHSTLRQLLTHNLDINAIPRRYFFEQIAGWSTDETHKERLLEFANPAYTDEYFDYTTRPRRSILEVLADFSSVKIPFSDAGTLFPVIRGRQYSICSGGAKKLHSVEGMQKVQLLAAVVKYKTVLHRVRQGLCSRYLASLKEDTVLNVTLIHKKSFYSPLAPRLLVPETHRTPLILIAAGTGVAPLRSLLWERASSYSEANSIGIADATLVYGGRNALADFFFHDEWRDPKLKLQVFTAFSRDQKEKIYIQDVIRQQGKVLADMIKAKALIYVCGSSGNMPKGVRAALVDVVAKYLVNIGEEDVSEEDSAKIKAEAEDILKNMENTALYIQETW
jgi:sulfite reductase alpha subunit-like flavoprotein